LCHAASGVLGSSSGTCTYERLHLRCARTYHRRMPLAAPNMRSPSVRKAEAIRGALRTGVVRMLVTDGPTARAVLAGS
jgi:Putative sugar-binding domain